MLLFSHLVVDHEPHNFLAVFDPSDLHVAQHVVLGDRLLIVRHVELVGEHLGLGPVALVVLLLAHLVGHEAHRHVVDLNPHEILVVSFLKDHLAHSGSLGVPSASCCHPLHCGHLVGQVRHSCLQQVHHARS